jgi:hypothetical protein
MFEEMLYRVWWWLMSEIPTVDGLHLEDISNYHWYWLSITGSFKIYTYKCLLCGKKFKYSCLAIFQRLPDVFPTHPSIASNLLDKIWECVITQLSWITIIQFGNA